MSELPYRRAAQLSDLQIGEPNAVTTSDGEPLCLIREGDKVYALIDKCSHRDFALSAGDMINSHVLECPWHGARFDCRSGHVLQGPATDDVMTYDVRIEAGEVFVGPRKSESAE